MKSAPLAPPTTGLPGLDTMLQGLHLGDNVVWQVNAIEDYLPFVRPFAEAAIRDGRRLVYFRFARHRQLVPDRPEVTVYRLHPEAGFEQFLTAIIEAIGVQGRGAAYVFDWLTGLAANWYSDRMLGNFFRITCPYLYEMDTVAYFGLRKHRHSVHALSAIMQTAQVVLEVFRREDQLYVHPLKVDQRHSPTLYFLHHWEDVSFTPVTHSALISEVLAGVPHPWLEFSINRPGVWVQTFHQARQTWEAVRSGKKSRAEARPIFRRLLKMAVTRDERFLDLAERYLDLADLVKIMQRMVGTGLIGGKSVGMLLARAILKKAGPRWAERLEAHDSFFIGSDVYYTYLVENGCWWLRQRQADFAVLLERAAAARDKMLAGRFPQYIQDQFLEIVEYFGQSPLIVRSSSFLEDNYGNAFSGKYESVFCANQGSPSDRLEAFMAAVRTVYASTLSAESLEYRKLHGLLDRDEQMALLVQRVSGERHGHLFFPPVAGVGFSYNPFVWHETIDPEAGFLRLVFGLGTRAVERTGDDYTRLVALNAPEKRPETRPENLRQFAQRRVDVLNLETNALATLDFSALAACLPEARLPLWATWDEDLLASFPPARRAGVRPWVLTFDTLLTETGLPADFRDLLRQLQTAYDYPVEVEFTVNFFPDGNYRINLLQCRPFQGKNSGGGRPVSLAVAVPPERLLLASGGPVVGKSLDTRIDRLIYVVPAVYGQMKMSQRYSVARAIGRLTHLPSPAGPLTLMLIGPGRWGTSMASVGVPVSFAEINSVTVLCEVALMREGLVPDISLGTHFFNDLVEMGMVYLAVSPEEAGHWLNDAWLRAAPNQLPHLLPSAAEWAEAIRVIDASAAPGGRMHLEVDSLKQRGLCYLE